MKSNHPALAHDRLKNRSDIGEVEFPIERLLRFRDAGASCVHIEAAMESEPGLTGLIKNRSRRTVPAIQANF